MKISENGVKLIKKFEGCRLVAYKAVPSEKYYTIGYGHYSEYIHSGQTITQEQADALLLDDIAIHEQHVNIYEPFYDFTQSEFDALVSFSFNVGSIRQLTKNGKRPKSEIARNMLSYCKSGGKVLAGLLRRRKEERLMFLSGRSVLDMVAHEVIQGKWSTNEERRKLLEAAGYDYRTVQNLVNKLLKEEENHAQI